MNLSFDDYRVTYHATQLSDVVKALEKRDFQTRYCASIDDANNYVLETIPSKATVGIGGSVTIRELGVIEELEHRGNTVVHHWKKGIPTETSRELRQQEGRSDYYLTSANAITRDGDIINIDGIGNRVAHMIYGPDNVIIVAGYNKIVADIELGIKRSKEIAAVMNAKRVGVKTPCATTGKCIDCNAPTRICRVTTIIQYRPWQTNIHVVLVNKTLGF
jgi:hypothetical protein